MKNKIPKNRLATALIWAPVIGVLSLFIIVLSLGDSSLVSQINFEADDALESFLSTAFMFMCFGLILAYPFMLVVGLPTIIYMETKRPSKAVVFAVYSFLGALSPVIVLYHPILLIPAVISGFFSGISVFTFMNLFRKDW